MLNPVVTHLSSPAAGTQFRLAIGEQIADAHGWSVVVTDGTDGGVRFERTGESVDV